MEIDLHPVRINHTFRIRSLVYTMVSKIASLFQKKIKKHETRSSGRLSIRKNVLACPVTLRPWNGGSGGRRGRGSLGAGGKIQPR